MALMVYTKRELVPSGVKVIGFGDRYFNDNTRLNKSDLVENILWHVDGVKYNTETTIISRVPGMGALSKDCLSSGAKTLLNIISHPDVCFSIENCGGNALELLVKFNSGMVLWGLPILNYDGDPGCDIILNGHKAYTDVFDFLDGLDEERF